MNCSASVYVYTYIYLSVSVFQTALELDLNDVYQPGSVLDMPKRPPWDYKMSKSKLDVKEEVYFRVSSNSQSYVKVVTCYFILCFNECILNVLCCLQ